MPPELGADRLEQARAQLGRAREVIARHAGPDLIKVALVVRELLDHGGSEELVRGALLGLELAGEIELIPVRARNPPAELAKEDLELSLPFGDELVFAFLRRRAPGAAR